VLKSLGATMAQLSQRLGTREPSPVPSMHASERAQAAARNAQRRRRLLTLALLAIAFVLIVTLFSTVFHTLMELEGRSYSWATSVYWTLTTMTTLGFGDITFESDAGRIFSVVVLLPGRPSCSSCCRSCSSSSCSCRGWRNGIGGERPGSLPHRLPGTSCSRHSVPVEAAMVEHAVQADVPYVLIVDDVAEAGRMHDEGRNVMVGALDDPTTYRNARVEQAALVVASQSTRSTPTSRSPCARSPPTSRSWPAPTPPPRSTSSRSPGPTTSCSSVRSSARPWRRGRSASPATVT
jgi:voltage-gated potassium channel